MRVRLIPGSWRGRALRVPGPWTWTLPEIAALIFRVDFTSNWNKREDFNDTVDLFHTPRPWLALAGVSIFPIWATVMLLKVLW